MSLISILICLILDRYTDVSDSIRCYDWFKSYINTLSGWLKDTLFWGNGWLILLSILLPLVVIAVIVKFLLDHVLWGILGFIFNVLVLFYCLGPSDLKQLFSEYFSAAAEKSANQAATGYPDENNSETAHNPNIVAGDNPGNSSSKSAKRANIVEEIFWQGNKQIAAIIFWFVILGAPGAIIYRALQQIRQDALQETTVANDVNEVSLIAIDYLDWLPVRLLAIGYALAGNFVVSFKQWISNVFSWPESNKQFLTACGIAALGNNTENNDQLAIDLFTRAMILWLLVLAVLTITAWIS